MEVAQGIQLLTQGVTNFYLIEESGRFTVVDAGTPKDWDFFVRSLTTLGQLADLEAVLLTHAHPDHTGFAEKARTETPAKVWVDAADAEAARTGQPGKKDGSVSQYLFRAEFYRTFLSLGRRGAAKMIPIKEVSSFSDGETIDIPAPSARPGTPRAAPPCCWRTGGSCSPGTSCARRTRSPAGSARRSCRPA